ncbi:unnamed protein product [Gadus morhua 'NCC']
MQNSTAQSSLLCPPPRLSSAGLSPKHTPSSRGTRARAEAGGGPKEGNPFTEEAFSIPSEPCATVAPFPEGPRALGAHAKQAQGTQQTEQIHFSTQPLSG